MAEFPKLAIKSREEFALLKSSLLTKYVGLKSKGKNKTPTLIQSRIGYADYELKLINKLTKGCEKAIEKNVEIDVQKLTVKLAKSNLKNKEQVKSA